MKVTILKKTVKEGVSARTGSNYKISSLFVKFEDSKIYENIVKYLQGKGASIEQIEKFCKPNVYNEKITYAFGLNCSNFTFERVDTFGILDATIIFQINDQGFINAKILVKDRKEQVLGYEAPEADVEGWAVEAPPAHSPEKSAWEDIEREARAKLEADPFADSEPMPKVKISASTLEELIPKGQEVVDDLPF